MKLIRKTISIQTLYLASFVFIIGVHALIYSLLLSKDLRQISSQPKKLSTVLSVELVEQQEVVALKRNVKKDTLEPLALIKEPALTKPVVNISKVSKVVRTLRSFSDSNVFFVKPIYPRMALKRKLEDVVKVQLKVDPRGHILDIKLIKKSRFSVFNQSVIQAAKKWKFQASVDNSNYFVVKNVAFKIN